MSSSIEIEEVLASFYGVTRAWTLNERTDAGKLVREHGMTPARAAFIADWIDQHKDGKFWRAALTERDGIRRVLGSIAQITEKSGVNAGAPLVEGWQAFLHYDDPAEVPEGGEAPTEQAERSREAKEAAVREPWEKLLADGQALNLKGKALSRWMFEERARRMIAAGVHDYVPIRLPATLASAEVVSDREYAAREARGRPAREAHDPRRLAANDFKDVER